MYDCTITGPPRLSSCVQVPRFMYRHEIGLAEVPADCRAQPDAQSKLHHCQCFAQRWLSGVASSKLLLRKYSAHVCRRPLRFLLLTHCSHSATKSVHMHLLLLIARKVLGCLVLLSESSCSVQYPMQMQLMGGADGQYHMQADEQQSELPVKSDG